MNYKGFIKDADFHFFSWIFEILQNLKNFKTLNIHKPLLGSCEAPQKNWAVRI